MRRIFWRFSLRNSPPGPSGEVQFSGERLLFPALFGLPFGQLSLFQFDQELGVRLEPTQTRLLFGNALDTGGFFLFERMPARIDVPAEVVECKQVECKRTRTGFDDLIGIFQLDVTLLLPVVQSGEFGV